MVYHFQLLLFDLFILHICLYCLEKKKYFAGKRRLKELLLQSDNRFCADCRAPDPKWA